MAMEGIVNVEKVSLMVGMYDVCRANSVGSGRD